MLNREMRVGGSVGRTLYLVDENTDDRKQDHLIGLVDTRELAAQIATCWNASRSDGAFKASAEFSARGLAALDNTALAHLVLSLLDKSLVTAGVDIDLATEVTVSVEVPRSAR